MAVQYVSSVCSGTDDVFKQPFSHESIFRQQQQHKKRMRNSKIKYVEWQNVSKTQQLHYSRFQSTVVEILICKEIPSSDLVERISYLCAVRTTTKPFIACIELMLYIKIKLGKPSQ